MLTSTLRTFWSKNEKIFGWFLKGFQTMISFWRLTARYSTKLDVLLNSTKKKKRMKMKVPRSKLFTRGKIITLENRRCFQLHLPDWFWMKVMSLKIINRSLPEPPVGFVLGHDGLSLGLRSTIDCWNFIHCCVSFVFLPSMVFPIFWIVGIKFIILQTKVSKFCQPLRTFMIFSQMQGYTRSQISIKGEGKRKERGPRRNHSQERRRSPRKPLYCFILLWAQLIPFSLWPAAG